MEDWNWTPALPSTSTLCSTGRFTATECTWVENKWRYRQRLGRPKRSGKDWGNLDDILPQPEKERVEFLMKQADLLLVLPKITWGVPLNCFTCRMHFYEHCAYCGLDSRPGSLGCCRRRTSCLSGTGPSGSCAGCWDLALWAGSAGSGSHGSSPVALWPTWEDKKTRRLRALSQQGPGPGPEHAWS